MKILIPITGILNGGDAAILEAMALVLSRAFGPAVRIEVYGRHADIARRYYRDLPFHPELYAQVIHKPRSSFLARVYGRLERTWEHPSAFRFYSAAWLYARGFSLIARVLLSQAQFEALRHYASADLVVGAGGTYLTENYDLEPNILDFTTALLLRRPLVLFTQSLGPFRTPKYCRRLRAIFRQATAILLREERSVQHIRQLGLPACNCHVTADAAFALADPQQWRPEVRGGPALRVCVSLREWPFFQHVPVEEGQRRYLAAVSELIAHLVRTHRAEIVLLSTCQGIPEYKFDDSRCAAQLHAAMPADVAAAVTVDSAFHSPEKLMEALRGFDLVIATRMHMSILALSAGVPALVIAYEFKSLDLFRTLGHASLAHDIETLSGEALIRSVDEVLANLSAVRDSLRAATLQQRARVDESVAYVAQALRNRR